MSRNSITRRPDFFGAFTPSVFRSETPAVAASFDQMRARANDLFRATFGDFPELTTTERFPAVNVSEDKSEFTVTAELPGMKMKDISVEFLDGVLTIKGQKSEEATKEQKDGNMHVWERQFGSFYRALSIPGGIAEDRLAAEYKDGILTVRLPKNEDAKTRRREIPVTAK